MQTFTGIEYIKIAAANEFGKDKLSWVERIKWFDDNQANLRALALDADNKFLYIKALNAYDDAMKGKPTGYIMALDATASGLQIMACLSGCKKTAAAVNLINTGKRQDVYSTIAHEMNNNLNQSEKVTRSLVKKPIMTH